MAIDLQAAIAVFDKSADRTRPNAQTEAWAVIRAELMRVMGAPVVELFDSHFFGWQIGEGEIPANFHMTGVRLVPVGGE